jgi:hypothetical protein
VKYAWIEEHSDVFSVSRMCRQLDISRTGYCQWRVRLPSKRSHFNKLLDECVSQAHSQSRRAYGRRRVQRSLEEDGIRVGHERVRLESDNRLVHRGQRVASHARSSLRGAITTVPEHLPSAHRAHMEWTPRRLIRW